MRRASVATVLAFAATLPGCSGFHARPPTPAYHFLERNYVFRSRNDSLLYEAQTAAQLFLIDGLPDAYDRLTREDSITRKPYGRAWAWRAITTPMFGIRQLADSSAAVRTPSFKPRILAVERVLAVGLGDPAVVGTVVAYNNVALYGFRGSLTHHSNGQAGCFREGYEPIDNTFDKCKPKPITDSTTVLPRDTMVVKLNASDGDFSSTYLGGLVYATGLFDFSHHDTPRFSVGAAAGYEWHPHGIFGALSDEQRPLYGSWRVRGQFEGMWVSGLTCFDDIRRAFIAKVGCSLRGRMRIDVEGERAPRASGPLADRFEPRILPWRGSVQLSHAFYWLLGVGPFVRWNDGQDYYNIGFVNRRRVTMLGVMLDVGGPDLLRRRDASNP